MPDSSPFPASFTVKGFQKNHRALQKDEFSKKKSCRSKAPTPHNKAKSSQQSNSFIFKRAGPVKAIPKTETKRKENPETTEHPSFSSLIEKILNNIKLSHHIHKLKTLSNMSNEGSRNSKVNALQKQDIQILISLCISSLDPVQ